MARRRRQSLALSGEHARQALAVLIHEGKLAAGEVRKALQRRDRLIRALRASLAALGEGVGRVGRRVGKDGPFPMVAKTDGEAPGGEQASRGFRLRPARCTSSKAGTWRQSDICPRPLERGSRRSGRSQGCGRRSRQRRAG